MPGNLLLLEPRCWYGLQSIAGRRGEPFDATPIFVTAVEPLRTGKGIVRIHFIRLLRPLRSAQETATLKVGVHTAEALIGISDGPEINLELIAITRVTMNWLGQHATGLLQRFPLWLSNSFCENSPDAQSYLGHFFGEDARDVLRGTSAESFRSNTGLPEPSRSGELSLDLELKGMDAWSFLRGFKPTDMDQKWFVFSTWRSPTSGFVEFRRSWTGFLTWRIPFEAHGDTLQLRNATVNLDEGQYTFGTKETERARILACMRQVLFGWFGVSSSESFNKVERASARRDWGLTHNDQINAHGDRFAEKLSLSAFLISDETSRRAFLQHLLDVGDGLLFGAIAHVWDSLAEPRVARCATMGAAAGVGGKGKVALRRVLKQFIREGMAAISRLPAQGDFRTFAAWSEAAAASFADDIRSQAAVVEKYSKILDGSQPECPPSPAGQVIEGPWTEAAKGQSPGRPLVLERTSSRDLEDLIEVVGKGDVRALSVRQPWAHHILHSFKDIENRTWQTGYRGWVLLHAAKLAMEGADASMPRGGIVGAVKIVDCVENSPSFWFHGPFGFQLESPIVLPLIPCRGMPGLFPLDETSRAAVIEAVRALLA